VLLRVVEAACELAGARYGALGVIAHDGSLEQFIHVGMDPALVERIGHLPEGKGLLGALITDPRPIRLVHISDDSRSSGFPAGHPPMDSFLGVPVRVRGEIFGNLYLTESATGQFSGEDEELVRSLAVTAGTAISHARLYEESRTQQRWLTASAEISGQLLTERGEDPLQMIARRAFEIAGADLVTVSLLTGDATNVMIEVAVGEGTDNLIGHRYPVGETLAGRSIQSGTPLLFRSPDDDRERTEHLSEFMALGPVMVIPLSGNSKIRGALTIARLPGRPAFDTADLTMATGFASHAGVALELADARADQQRVVLLEDRDRIARDLHDHVIQRLFAIGLSLEGAAAAAGSNSDLSSKIHDRVDDIDRTIRQIRTSIFELRGPLAGASEGLRQSLLAIASELTSSLGVVPSLTFAGAIDAVVDDDLAQDVLAVLREGLTNIAKHAHATAVDVDVTALAEEVCLSIGDNGTGIEGATRSSGLANLRSRAEHRRGTLTITNRPTGGTQLIWKVPIV
jgi:signal transduction histidine kinase